MAHLQRTPHQHGALRSPNVVARPLRTVQSTRATGAAAAAARAAAQASSGLGEIERLLQLSTTAPAGGSGALAWRSRSYCQGQCCDTPLARNRTCAFRDLLFTPPARFSYLSDDGIDRSDVHATFLHNRFQGSDTTGKNSHSRLNVVSAPLTAALGVTRVIDAPLYIGADVHSNIAHRMLDSVFPLMAALLTLKAGIARSPAAVASDFGTLPDAVRGNFTFLLYDAPKYTAFHRHTKERTWTAQLAGRGVVDVEELARACPSGCIVRTAWVGAGHMGLCAVDAHNAMGGALAHRALFRFRQRIYHSFRVLPGGASAGGADGPGLPQALVVRTKRRVRNLEALVEGINRAGFARARLIRWEDMSFVQQLKVMRSAAVQVSGVGSAQINQFLMPPGSVAIALGWREDSSRHGIHYFDSHILRSMDHVRTLYYPSYSAHERRFRDEVELDLAKAVGLVREAVALYRAGFAVPVPLSDNANKFDRAFTRLVELTDGKALQQRTDDFAWGAESVPVACTRMNGVDRMLWQADARQCVWQPYVAQVIREFDL